jgi:hypothetical protein
MLTLQLGQHPPMISELCQSTDKLLEENNKQNCKICEQATQLFLIKNCTETDSQPTDVEISACLPDM